MSANYSSLRKPVSVRFHALFPAAQAVYLVGDFTGWVDRPIPFRQMPDRNWYVEVQLKPGHYQYAFAVDGCVELDPKASGTVDHPRFQKVCVLVVD